MSRSVCAVAVVSDPGGGAGGADGGAAGLYALLAQEAPLLGQSGEG